MLCAYCNNLRICCSFQSSQSAFHEQHINGFDEEELFDLGDGDDGMDDVNMNGFDDIFGQDFDSKLFFVTPPSDQF